MTAREPHPILPDQGIETVRCIANEIHCVCGFCGSHDRLLARSVEPPIGDIGCNRVVEQHNFLRNQCNIPSQAIQRQALEIVPVERNAALGWRVKARK